jgi:hypothetical protein
MRLIQKEMIELGDDGRNSMMGRLPMGSGC